MVASPKKHISNLGRNTNSNLDRSEYLRMDKNENLIGFSTAVINDFKNMITSDFITAYPETDSLYLKLSQNLKVKTNQIYLSWRPMTRRNSHAKFPDVLNVTISWEIYF